MPRFNRRGVEQVFLVTSIANQAAPTAAEILAGIELHPVLRSLNGWTSAVDDLDAGDMSSTWEKTSPGGEKPENSTFTFYAGDADSDDEEVVRDAHVEGASRFVVFCKRGAPTATEPCNLFPVRIKAANDDETAENATATWTAQYSIYDPPHKNVAIA